MTNNLLGNIFKTDQCAGKHTGRPGRSEAEL